MKIKKIAVISTLLLAGAAQAAGPQLKAQLNSFHEVPSVVSHARGAFTGNTAGDWNSIEWELSYELLQGSVTQAHIHLAQRGVNGPIVIWLCGTTSNPGPSGTQTCPQAGTVRGTISSANVLASPAAQQLSAGQIGDMIVAMDSGFAYVNVHTTASAGGEIRGQINP